MRDRTRLNNKSGSWKKKKNHFHFFIGLLLEHVTVNETGVFGIPPNKEYSSHYFAYTLPFY